MTILYENKYIYLYKKLRYYRSFDTLNNLTHFWLSPVKQNSHSPQESATENVKRSPTAKSLSGRRWVTTSTTASWPRTLETKRISSKKSV